MFIVFNINNGLSSKIIQNIFTVDSLGFSSSKIVS